MSSLFPLNPPPRPPLLGRRARMTLATLTAVLVSLAATPVLAGPASSNRSPRVTRPSLSTGLAFSVTGPATAAPATIRAATAPRIRDLTISPAR
jgi:hypothetical protein